MKLWCLVDNCVRPQGDLWGEHGASYLIESGGMRALFDTGSSGTVLLHNLRALEIAPGTLTALVLSHAHLDHTGGVAALAAWQQGIALFAHPEIFRPRFRKGEDGYKQVGLQWPAARLREWFHPHLSAEPVEAIPNVWTTGEIRQREAPEGRSPRHYVQTPAGYIPDPYQDDLSLVLQTEKGLVLLCGCCHAGLVNTLRHVQSAFEGPLLGVVGGTHLMDADAEQLRQVVELLMAMSVPRLWLNHCTGHKALAELARAFGERVQPCPAGTVLEL
ncbi:MAG: MBL fold metallo-hydrolase [Anaerolineae bacterium]